MSLLYCFVCRLLQHLEDTHLGVKSWCARVRAHFNLPECPTSRIDLVGTAKLPFVATMCSLYAFRVGSLPFKTHRDREANYAEWL